MKKILFALAITLFLSISLFAAAAADENAPVVYVYQDGLGQMEITLTSDTACSVYATYEDGTNVTVICNYCYDEEQLVILLGSEELARFEVTGTTLTAVEKNDESVTPTVEELAPIDYSSYIKYFVSYLQSGEAPQELIDSIITIGEDLHAMETEGYTFWERLAQLFTAENILTFATALCLIIVTIVFLVWRRKNKNTELDINDILLILDSISKQQISDGEAKTGELKEISKMKNNVESMLRNVELAANGSLAVAKMMKDVFLSARTLDADGKALVMRNYVEAVNALTGGDHEQSNESASV